MLGRTTHLYKLISILLKRERTNTRLQKVSVEVWRIPDRSESINYTLIEAMKMVLQEAEKKPMHVAGANYLAGGEFMRVEPKA